MTCRTFVVVVVVVELVKLISLLFVCLFVCLFHAGGMFTANTMSSIVETLGMTLPGQCAAQ